MVVGPTIDAYGVGIPVLPIVLVVVALGTIEWQARSRIRVSPLSIPVYAVLGMINTWRETDTKTPRSGRERYASRGWDSIRIQFARLWGTIRGRNSRTLRVDSVRWRDPSGPVRPRVHDEQTSTIYLGQTGQGKSTLLKSRIAHWDENQAVVAHALSERDGNEFEQYFQTRDKEIIRLSTRNSTARWDPFLDYESSPAGMESLAQSLYDTAESKDTGWDPTVQALLVGALSVTNAKYGDFAKLTEVLSNPPEEILAELENVPDTAMIQASLRSVSGKELSTVYTMLLNELRGLFQTDIFDTTLPRQSIESYFEDPEGRVLLLDNVREDRHARQFWRLCIETAIDLSFETSGRQQFVLDEVDKLPAIANLTELLSRGRSSNALGAVAAQDATQLFDVYGEITKSMFANCPNGICFRAEDGETAEMVLESLGERDVLSQDVNTSVRDSEADIQSTHRYEKKYPFPPAELKNLDRGEAFVKSNAGWWIADLYEEDLAVDVGCN